MHSIVPALLALQGLLILASSSSSSSSSTGSTIDWRVAVDYLGNCHEIVVCSSDDAPSIANENELPLPVLVYNTRSSRDVRTSLHRYRTSSCSNVATGCTSAIDSEPSGYLCQARNTSDALTIVDDLGPHSPRARIVIRVDRAFPDYDSSSVLRYAWTRYNVINAIVIRPEGNGGATLLTYNPFERTGNGTRGAARAFPVREGNRSDVLAIVEATQEKRFANMQDYPLNVTIFDVMILFEGVHDENGTIVDYIGLDASLHKVLVERMKYRPHAARPRVGIEYGRRDREGHFWGSIGDIEYNYTMLAANIRFMMDYGTTNVVFTTPVKQTRLCYVVPKKHPPMSVIPLIPPMDGTTGIVIVLAFACSSAVWHLIRAYYHHHHHRTAVGFRHYGLCDALERSFRLLISASLRKPLTTPERYLYLVLSYLSLILLNVYEGLIVTEITWPGYSVDIHTLRQLEESDLRIGIASGLNELADLNFKDDVETTYDRLRMREIIFEKSNDIMAEETFNRSSAILVPEVMADYMVNTLASERDGSDLVHKVEECPLTYYSAYTVPKHSPYVDRINGIIMNLHDSGIISKWVENITFTVKMARVRRAKRYGSSSLVKFSVFYYWKAFLLYGVCIAASIVVFVVEVTCPNTWTTRDKERPRRLLRRF